MTSHPKVLLDAYGYEPKKSLGQNFLFDKNVLGRVTAAAELQPTDSVLEIGPGLGSLTRQLAATAQRVVAVELDSRLVPILESELADLHNVKIIQGDILEHDPAQIFAEPYKIVANVPYYITGAILRHFLSSDHKPEQMVLTVQKEVADRLTAEPPQMSLLAVSVLYYGTVERVATLKAGAFWPRPDVDSAVIKITVNPKNASDEVREQAFFRLVRAGFSQKRKQLQKNLRQLGYDREVLKSALKTAAIDGARRAETLSLLEWLVLTEALAGRADRHATADG